METKSTKKKSSLKIRNSMNLSNLKMSRPWTCNIERKVRKRIQDALVVCPQNQINNKNVPQPQEQNVEKFYEDVMDKCIDIADMHYSDNGV